MSTDFQNPRAEARGAVNLYTYFQILIGVWLRCWGLA